jgi:hypothetical protein
MPAKKTAKKTAPKKVLTKKANPEKKECETHANTCSQDKGRLRQRIVIMLLAFNFLFTGYLVHSVIKLQDAILSTGEDQTAEGSLIEVPEVPPLPEGQ